MNALISQTLRGPRWLNELGSCRARVAQWVRELDYLTTHTSLSPIWHGFAPGFVNYKKGCTWLRAASDKVYQLLAHGRWFSPASSITKTDRHDIAEILLKVVLKHQKLWKVVEKYLMNRAISIYLINKHGSKSELFIALFIAALPLDIQLSRERGLEYQ